MRLFLFIAGLFGLLAATQQPDVDVARSFEDLAVERRSHGSPQLKPRATDPTGRPKCGLELFVSSRYTPTPAGTSSRRWMYELEGANGTLAPLIFGRQMTLPGSDSEADMATFMVNEGAKKQNRLLAWRPPRQKISRDVNNAYFDQIRDTRNPKAFGQGLDHLAGCTGLMIVSRTGVYGGHYWENIGFDIDKDIQGDLYSDQEDAFQKSILDALQNGVGTAHASLTAAAGVIGDDDTVKAFLMIPDTGPAGEGQTGKADPYRDYWNRMKTKIGEIIPKLADVQDPKRWQEVPYHPVQDEERTFQKDADGNLVLDEDGDPICTHDPMDDTTRGRMLCKFDPDHDGKKKLAVWIENKLWHDDSW